MDIEQSFSQDDVSLTFPMRKEDAAPLDIHSNNSMLSSDDDDDDEEDKHNNNNNKKQHLLADPSVVYMEQASMEATPADAHVTKIEASGRLGRRLSSRSECILVANDESFALMDHAGSTSLGQSRSGGDDSVLSSHRSCVVLAQSESDVFAAPTGAVSTLGSSPGAATAADTAAPQQQHDPPTTTNGHGSVDHHHHHSVMEKEEEGHFGGSLRKNDSSNWSILEKHGILVSKKKQKNGFTHSPPWKKKSDSDALYTLLETFCDPPVSMETCRATLLLEATQLYEDTPDIRLPDPLPMISLHHEQQNSIVALLLHPQCLQELSSSFLAAVLRLLVRLLSGESNTEYSVAVGALSPTLLPTQHTPSTDTTNNSSSTTNPNDAYYQVVRFQCAWMQHCNSTNAATDRLAVATVLDLRDQYKLLPFRPLSRLVAVCAAAGVTPHLLRRLRFHVQPTRPPQVSHTFLFASRPLRRTVTGLGHWPFRNDFGFALWFRAERFTASVTTTLLSVQGQHSIDITLVPVPDHEGACTVAVSTGGETVHEQGFCVLPRVWYHLAVRHTRSRMKGVFKLSTREQLSILLNAKTMVTTESLPFPAEDAAATKGSTNVTVTLGENFEGQTGALYVFDDNVSDASLRALYELSARSTVQRSISSDNSWDARRGDLVRKSRVLDATITKDDADEIVLSHRRPRRGAAQTISRVIDLMDNSVMEEADDAPQELSRSAFGSKVFLSWDPRRTVGKLALDLHIGAHVSLDGVFAWSFLGAQDVISSVGGVQALIPFFRSQLLGNWSGSNSYAISMAIPNMFKILASFVRDHNDNARELLRCGGVDVIEQLLHSAKKLAAGKQCDTTVFGTLSSHTRLVSLLVDSLFELRAACSHYVGLETKIYSRLLFNINLWFGGFSSVPGSSLHTVLLPVLARLSNENPQKVRDCVGTVEMLHAIKAYAIDRPEAEPPTTNRFRETSDDFCPLPLSDVERKQCVNLLLGILFNVLSSGTSPRDFPAFLHLLSFALDDGRAVGQVPSSTTKQARERRELALDMGMLLMLLFQLRPCVVGLFESFAHTCGGVQGGVSWILSSLVDTKDDEFRSIGIRCLGSYLEVTSKGPDSHLSIFIPSESISGTDMMDSQSEVANRTSVRRTRSRFSNLAKGIATMGPGVRTINLPPSKLTTRVVLKVCVCHHLIFLERIPHVLYPLKLLWHLLKSHRSDIGTFTHVALLDWITDDEGSAASSLSSRKYLTANMVHLLNGQTTFSFDSDWIASRLKDTGSLAAKVLRNPLAISTIFRLLRFLEAEQRDLWLKNILELSKSNRKCVALLAGLPEWQHSLFSFLSETLEQVSARRRKVLCLTPDKIGDSGEVLDVEEEESSQRESAESLHQRLDQSLNLYAVLLGYLLRSGGDQALEAVEKTAALERVFVNGHDVLLLILSSFCSNIAEEGTLLEIGALSAQDWKDVDLEAILLKQSAKLITDAILSNGTKGLEMATAVRSWRGLRHLLEVIVAIVTKCRYVVIAS